MTEEEVRHESEVAKAIKKEAVATISWSRVLLVINAFLLFVVIIIVAVLEIQVQSRNEDIRTVKKVQNDTKVIVQQAADSSSRAEKAINDAIKNSRAASGTNSQFVNDIRTGLAEIKENKATLDEIKAFIEQLKGQ